MTRPAPSPALSKFVRPLFVLVIALGALTTASAAETDYHTYDSLLLELDQLAQDHPSIAQVVELAPASEQSRSLIAIKISDNVDADEDENRVLFTGAHHAREWISVEVPFFLAKHLIENYETDPLIRDLVDHEEIWIIPVTNPDGFTYSELDGNRLWRKNRRDNGFFCSLFDSGWGVDLNRNYGSATWGSIWWDPVHNSLSCLGTTYLGPDGFSELETQAIRDLMSRYDFDVVLSYHSYSQLILYPWGHTEDPVPNPADEQLMSSMAREMEQRIEAVPGAADYTPQQSSELYPTAGDLTDWTYETFGIPSFTIELRPHKYDADAFELPPEEIQPTWEENKPAALYLIDSFNLKVAKPSQSKPANAGPADQPTKIRVIVAGLWRGVSAADFSVTVGGVPAEVVASTRLPEVAADGEVQLGYELQVQPPVQPENGIYDLEVSVGDASALVPQAVVYQDAANVDVVLVIDRSGSMVGEPIADAQEAAKQFVDLMAVGDRVGVVSFSDGAVVDYALTAIEGAVKDDVKAAIDSIIATGGTSIGAGLTSAYSQFTTGGDPTHPWVAVVLSDGMSVPVGDIIDSLKSAGITVYSIGLGPSVDEVLLQDIASQTGGSYYYAPTSEELAAIYASLSASVSGQQSLLSLDSAVQQDGTDVQQAVVDSTVSEVTFAISWPGSDLDLTLTSPSGRVIDPAEAIADPAIEYISGATYEYYRVQEPEPGLWLMSTFGRSVTAAEEPYSVRVDARSELQMDLVLHGEARTGSSVRLEASLVDSQPIAGANVWVDVIPPAITPAVTISLYDDGQHEDGAAGDGVYANRLEQLDHSGLYQFHGYAVGTTSAGGTFTRQAYRTLLVEAAPIQTVDVSAPPDFFAEPGTTATITFTVTNTGSVLATYKLIAGPVEVTQWAQLDTLPDGVAVSPGSSQSVVIPLSIPPTEEQPLVNVLTLRAIDQVTPEVSDSASVVVTADMPRADLSVAIEGPEAAAPGTEQDFRITITNNGPTTATDVFLSCEAQTGMEIVGDSLGNGEAISDTVRMWYLPPVPAGASSEVSVALMLVDGGSTESSLRISAGTASGYTATGPTVGVQDPDLVNNQASLDVLLTAQHMRVYLPLLVKRWPPIPDAPVLNSISNPDGDGTYTVAWNAAYLADSYVLQEDDNAAFSSPVQTYSGSGTSWAASGRSAGTYYYRVKARNVWGDSLWSNIQQVRVSPPAANVYVQNDTIGTLCYEVYGSGHGEKCFAFWGTSSYGTFPSGTYGWHASSWCGSTSGTTYYGPGDYTHRFWCGTAQDAPFPLGQDSDQDGSLVLRTAIVGPSR